MRSHRSIGLAAFGSVVTLGFAATIIANRAADARRSELAGKQSLCETCHDPIEYVSWGEGPTVLVIHGAGGGFDPGRLLVEQRLLQERNAVGRSADLVLFDDNPLENFATVSDLLEAAQ
ncbi:hypothetical protein [Erythrobacter ani]|uniref:Cytochrome c domain-containing protein n=1 Tax=Erythrobacter ani TaxID=2827235 RepID=A0ABS6SKC4_9SPHN|nr:hypothetical protein [Erythrobacter ani]MBV7265465.1 hypothetical protein [Erythrobacter ani]